MTVSSLTARPLRILTVDDHPASRLLLKQQLIRLGYKVVAAENKLTADIRASDLHTDKDYKPIVLPLQAYHPALMYLTPVKFI